MAKNTYGLPVLFFWSPYLYTVSEITPLNMIWISVTQQKIEEQILQVSEVHWTLHPWKIKGWNTVMEIWLMIFLCKWVIFRFRVNFQECESQTCLQKNSWTSSFPNTTCTTHYIGAYIVCYQKQTQHLHPYTYLKKSSQPIPFKPPFLFPHQNRPQNRAPYRLWSLQWLSPRRGWPEWSWRPVVGAKAGTQSWEFFREGFSKWFSGKLQLNGCFWFP